MKIKDIMEKPIFVSPSASRKNILAIAKKNPRTILFIVAGADKKFLGDMHENDLFYMLIPDEHYETIGMELALDIQKKFFAKTAKEIMRKHDVSCRATDDIHEVMLQFAREEVNEMPVLDDKNRVVGIITQGMILRCMKA